MIRGPLAKSTKIYTYLIISMIEVTIYRCNWMDNYLYADHFDVDTKFRHFAGMV